MDKWNKVEDGLPDDSELVAYLCEDGDTGFSKMLNSYVKEYGNPIRVKYWVYVNLPEFPEEEKHG